MAFAFFLYYLVRGAAEERIIPAYHTAYRIVELERDLALFWEIHMQDWAWRWW